MNPRRFPRTLETVSATAPRFEPFGARLTMSSWNRIAARRATMRAIADASPSHISVRSRFKLRATAAIAVITVTAIRSHTRRSAVLTACCAVTRESDENTGIWPKSSGRSTPRRCSSCGQDRVDLLAGDRRDVDLPVQQVGERALQRRQGVVHQRQQVEVGGVALDRDRGAVTAQDRHRLIVRGRQRLDPHPADGVGGQQPLDPIVQERPDAVGDGARQHARRDRQILRTHLASRWTSPDSRHRGRS